MKPLCNKNICKNKKKNDGLFIRVNGKGRELLEKIWMRKGHELRYLKEMNKHKIGRFCFIQKKGPHAKIQK